MHPLRTGLAILTKMLRLTLAQTIPARPKQRISGTRLDSNRVRMQNHNFPHAIRHPCFTAFFAFLLSATPYPAMSHTLLGGLTPQQFLAEYWQKKPLLVRQAIPGFNGLLSRDQLFDLACDPDVESRYIRQPQHNGDKQDTPAEWVLEYGPQKRSRLRGKRTPWTVLVQGLNLWIPSGETLLHRFNFIPQARLDDLMVSYAVDGGGVGPHFDNYDVFLLQGTGKRRWRIGNQQDHALLENAPLRILKNFQPVFDWVLEPGDMLYLPPHWAHDGIAIGECTTYSIGFRSPSAQELGEAFLDWMRDRIKLEGIYTDPDLTLQNNAAYLSNTMIDRIADMLSAIRWNREDIAGFIGNYLSEPKPHLFFDPPEHPLTAKTFSNAIRQQGYTLDARTQLLWSDTAFHLNGETLDIAPSLHTFIQTLAHQRTLPPDYPIPPSAHTLLYTWYCDGFAHPRYQDD